MENFLFNRFQIQLLVTLAFILLVKYEKNTLALVQNNMALLLIAIIVSFVAIILMACVESVRRTSPTNMIVLTIFTLAETYVVGAATMRFDPSDVCCNWCYSVEDFSIIRTISGLVFQVLIAIGVTAAVCVGLTIFAFQTKWDFTMMGGILFVGLIILILFGLIGMFFPGRIMTLVYSSCGAMLFSVYLIYDTQMVNCCSYSTIRLSWRIFF